MIDIICFAAGPLIEIGGASITLQTQDQWRTFLIQILGVLVGGAITLGANYYLQNRLFNAQNNARQMDRRLVVYSDLLRDISEYEVRKRHQNDLRTNMAQVNLHGSEKVKDLTGRGITTIQNGTSFGMDALIVELKKAMEDEILQMKLPD